MTDFNHCFVHWNKTEDRAAQRFQNELNCCNHHCLVNGEKDDILDFVDDQEFICVNKGPMMQMEEFEILKPKDFNLRDTDE